MIPPRVVLKMWKTGIFLLKSFRINFPKELPQEGNEEGREGRVQIRTLGKFALKGRKNILKRALKKEYRSSTQKPKMPAILRLNGLQSSNPLGAIIKTPSAWLYSKNKI